MMKIKKSVVCDETTDLINLRNNIALIRKTKGSSPLLYSFWLNKNSYIFLIANFFFNFFKIFSKKSQSENLIVYLLN